MNEQEYATLQTMTRVSGTDKKKTWIYHLIFFAAIVLAVILDQWSKHMAVSHLKGYRSHSLIVWKPILQLTYVENKGAAWGILQGRSVLLLAISAVVLLLIVYVYHNIPFQKRYLPVRIIMALLCAGAIGNMIDRIVNGFVVDFFEFGFINFPVFNVADIYVSVAAILLILLGLFFYKDKDFEVLMGKKKRLETDVEQDEESNHE